MGICNLFYRHFFTSQKNRSYSYGKMNSETIYQAVYLILYSFNRLNTKTDLKNYDKGPDGGCVLIEKRRISQYTGFVEVKADYQKNNTHQTHGDLLRLALFASNGYDEYNTECILVLQAIGKVTKQLASCFELKHFCPKSRIKHNSIRLYSTCEWCQRHV